MVIRYTKLIVLVAVFLSSIARPALAHTDIAEKQINVTMRMIGHELLLCVNDHKSRILAIEKNEDRYKIEFSSEFEFDPEDLAPIIRENLKKTGIDKNYIVEVEECESKLIVYSYRVGGDSLSDLVPCGGRIQPKACYKIFITLFADIQKENLKYDPNLATSTNENLSFLNLHRPPSDYIKLSLVGLPTILLIGLVLFFRKQKDKLTTNPDLISIGKTLFDQKNMQLSLGKEITELTSKESDLLSLLIVNSNKTVEREKLLQSVWGDEGDYVGRTLDVFISKLRKKLETEQSAKIINIRGVGYKLVLN